MLSVRLRDVLLAGPVDMLKVDIEGAEEQVMADCADAIGHAQNLYVATTPTRTGRSDCTTGPTSCGQPGSETTSCMKV